MSVLERLDEVLNSTGAPQSEGHHWEVTDQGSADWALRKIRKLQSEIDQVTSLANEQIDALIRWRDGELESLTASRSSFETLLAAYHRKRLQEDEKAKTLRFPHGTLKARKAPDGIEIEDEVALLDWALEHNRFVRVKESLDRAAVKEAVLKDGESIPGVTPVVGDACEVRFVVDLDTEVEG